MKFSTGLRNKMLDTGSFKSIMALGEIKVYSGTAPATADAAATGTLLCTYTVSSGGTKLSMAASAADGVLTKDSATWSGVPVATGTAGYYRHVAAGDTGASSTTEARVQGTVGQAGADFLLGSTSFVTGVTREISYYAIGLPTE